MEQIQTLTGNIFDDYSNWTDNVAVYPKVHEPHYLALGLMEEMGELYNARQPSDVIAEAGDVFWYAARYARLVLNVPFSVIADPITNLSSRFTPMEALSVIAGVEKKRLRDGDTWDEAKCEAKRASATEALVYVVEHCRQLVYQRTGATAEQVIRVNIDKLSARKAASTIQGDGDKR